MKSRNLIDSFNYAVSGIIYALKSEKNMKIHFFAAILILFVSLFLDLSRVELLLLFFAISLVIISEMFNTSIEKAIDLITEEYHPLAKIAKNVAAGAVLVSTINSVVVGYLIFFDRLDPYAKLLIHKIKNSSVHLTFIALAIVIFLTVGIKTIKKSGTPFQGGIVSGHSATAFCAATIISFIGENVLISTLAFFMAFLVAESRIEGKIHSVFEVIMGSALGFIIATLVFQLIG